MEGFRRGCLKRGVLPGQGFIYMETSSFTWKYQQKVTSSFKWKHQQKVSERSVLKAVRSLISSVVQNYKDQQKNTNTEASQAQALPIG